MDFEFSSEALQIKDEARRVLADLSSSAVVRQVIDAGSGIDRKLWSTLGELGFLGAAIPEEYGGTGAGMLALCAIVEEMGRAVAPVPFSSSICLAADLLLAADHRDARTHWLPRLAGGASIACVGLAEGPGRCTPPAVAARFDGVRLTGSKTAVPDGMVADVALVAARDAQDHIVLTLLELDAPGVRRTHQDSIDPSRSLARIDFDRAPALLLAGSAWPLLTRALDRAAVLMAFEQIGCAARALETARGYAQERYAFGRPIGSFQALKHKLVDMFVGLTLARSNCYYGAWALDQNAEELPEAAAAARVSATESAQLCVKGNIQVHGGLGFTWDLDCHLLYRRAHLMALALGGLGQWQDRLIDSLRERRATDTASAA